MSPRDLSKDGFASATVFGVLGPLGDSMDLGFAEEAGPRDLHMVDYGARSLKRCYSPSKMPKSSSRASLLQR